MKIFLAVSAIIFLLLVLGVLIALRILLRKLKKVAMGVSAALAGGTPGEITLLPQKLELQHPTEFQQAEEALQKIGFSDRQTYHRSTAFRSVLGPGRS